MGNDMNHRDGEERLEACDEILDLASSALARPVAAPLGERIERHLGLCRSCASDVRFMQRLFRARPQPPSGLTGRVLDRVESGTRYLFEGWRSGSLAAAAVLLLALGAGLATQASNLESPASEWELAIDDESLGWASEDWLVAGAPHLAGVSDETLLALLNEEGY